MREQTPKRYDLITNYRCGSSIEEMELADDGEWVRWESVEAELSALRAEQTRLREALLNVGKVTFHGQFVPPEGPYLLMAEVLPILTAALSSTPTPEHSK